MTSNICELRQLAAQTARGHPDVERCEFDAYLIERDDGTWQAEARGLVVGSGLKLERAEMLVEEHGAGRALWLVPLKGMAVLLREEL